MWSPFEIICMASHSKMLEPPLSVSDPVDRSPIRVIWPSRYLCLGAFSDPVESGHMW